MGIYLSTPKTDKTSEDGENNELRFGASAMQGWRESMEDAHTAILDVDKDTSIFGIFDGHGGKAVSKFCSKHLHKEVVKSQAYASGDLAAGLEHAFLRMDEMMKGERGWRELQLFGEKGSRFGGIWEGHGHSVSKSRGATASEGSISSALTESNDDKWIEEEIATKHSLDAMVTVISRVMLGLHSDFTGPTSGSTAVVAIIRSNKLVVANAGDSRCIISRNGKAVDLSIDHKPELELEKQRILLAGGFIHAGRVNGSLNLTRAIGDMEFKYQTKLTPDKQIVTCCPDVQHVELGPGDEFVVLACDGIWDVMSSQDVVDFVHQKLPTAKSLSALCEELLDQCLSSNTRQQEGCDNMSIILVQLKKIASLSSASTDRS